MPNFHPSAQTVLTDLRSRYPDAPLLALGQTVWWDEPMKAVLREMLDGLGLGGKMILGVHDTDYFAKAKVRQSGQSRFELVPHNDGSTKDLWSAAGEISQLFGSETVPTRHDFLRYGVPFDRLVKDKGDAGQDFVNAVTEAWGWRGLVYTGSRDLIVHNLPLSEVGDAVEEMLQYGFEGAIESLADECCRKEARQVAGQLLQWVNDYRLQNTDKTLSDLYQYLFPRLICLLLGEPPSDVEVSCTACLLRLTPETANLPRFEFVDLFLNQKTRTIAAEAYNHAVQGSEVYTLDRFGLGALPFDVIVPEHGRGTLRVTLRAIHIETRKPIRIPLKQPVESISELAGVLSFQFGDQVVLVGKAVALISMLAREFIFVFNEEGSGYVSRTRKMNDYLRERGIELHAHPILRLQYNTWDSLEVGLASLRLPEHLKSAFGTLELEAARFASSWRNVVRSLEDRMDDLRNIRSPRNLLDYLNMADTDSWAAKRLEYERTKRQLLDIRKNCLEIQDQITGLYANLAKIKDEIRVTERAKGNHFRTTSDWTMEEDSRRKGYDEEIRRLLRSRKEILAQVRSLKERRLEVERGPKAAPLRRRIVAIELDAQSARLRLVRGALITARSLTHTQHRPSAWWLPMVDPKGHWFRRIVETTEVYTEPLLT